MTHDNPEIWKQVFDFPDYEVSNLGRVRSWKRRANGEKPPHIITPKNLNNHGHKFFEVWEKGKRKKFSIHRTVLELFVGPCPEGMEACHKNDIPHDNRVENLRWDTHKNNGQDMVANGHSQRGTKNPKAKLTKREVEIVNVLIEWLREDQIALAFGVSKATINSVCSGRTWRYGA